VIETISTWGREKASVVNPRSYLVPTCGTVVLIDPTKDPLRVVDPCSGAEIKQQRVSSQSRCDSGNRTVATRTKPASIVGGPLFFQNMKLGDKVSEFDVSRSGWFIAFNNDGNLCVYDRVAGSKILFGGFSPNWTNVGWGRRNGGRCGSNWAGVSTIAQIHDNSRFTYMAVSSAIHLAAGHERSDDSVSGD
jgi:hypothetical protein